MLDFARQTKPQKQSIDLNKIALDVLALVKNQASFRNISIITELDEQIPQVLADADQMRQVILNIVINAADAMPYGGTLTLHSSFEPKSQRVELKISDTGSGIPKEIQNRLFEPFFTTKKSGTGLGLAIAYGVIERHKGELKLESSPGKGTTVTIVLPVSSEASDE